MTRRGLATTGLLCVLLVVLCAPASAATRLAAPGASGGEPCSPAPCGLALAVSGAKNGDQVVVAPGNYKVTGDLVIDKAVDVGGTPGAAVSIETEEGVNVENLAAALHDVRLSLAESTMHYTLFQEGGTVERVYADGSNGSPCLVESGLMRDSVCFGGLYASSGEPGTREVLLRNVTADPLLVGAFGGAKMAVSAVNVVALPGSSGGSGLELDVATGSTAVATLTNSNYNSVDTSLSTGSDFTYTPAGTNGNRTEPPLLVNAAAGDFRQLPGSPTIDAGLPEAPIDPFDLSGAPRVQGPCGVTPVVDVGAYEYAYPGCPDAGGGNGGATAPKQVELDPPPPLPRLGKLRRHPAVGTATLPVSTPAAGMVTLSGKGVVVRTLHAKGAETVRLVIKAKGRKAKRLRSTGKVKLLPTIAFVQRDGTRMTALRPLTLKLRPAA